MGDYILPPMLSTLAFSSSLGFAVTAVAGALIVLTQRWHGAFSYDSVSGVQKFHGTPTPRIGGLALYVGYWAATSAAPPPLRDLMVAVGASAAFALSAGVIEDVTKGVSAAVRLAVTLFSGLVFCLVTGYAITRLEIPFVDQALTLPLVAIAFTAFAIAGLAHAINIIDGFHGLATGSGIIMLVAFAAVSVSAGDHDMASFCFIVASVLLGFLLVNFPFGYIFLGTVAHIFWASSLLPWPSWFRCGIPTSPRGSAWSYWPIPCWKPGFRSFEKSAEGTARSNRTDCICTCWSTDASEGGSPGMDDLPIP